MELNYGVTTHLSDIKDLPIKDGVEFSFGGMVTAYETRPTRNGGTFGILKLEDYTGSYEIRLFGNQVYDFGRYGIQGTPIFVKARYQKRKYGDQIDLNVESITLLQDMKGKVLNGIRIKATLDDIPQLHTLLKDYTEKAKKEENPGTLSFRLFDPKVNRWVGLRSPARLPMSRQLVDMLDSLNIEYEFN